MKKILFATNIPSPYRVNFFNLLAEKVDLTVIYERATASDRQTEWKASNQRAFTEIFLNGLHVGAESSLSLGFLKYLHRKSFDCVVIGGYSSPTWMLAIAYCRLRRIPYWITSDGALTHTDKGWKLLLKRFLIGGAKQCLCTSKVAKEYLTQYIPQEKCHIFPFSSLYEKDILKKVPSHDEKLRLRQELGLHESHIVICVGRYIHCKGFDLLLQAARSLNSSIGFYLIGDIPPQELVDFKVKHNLTNVHFLRFMPYDQLCRYYQSADLFVLPTRGDSWGLVVHEALANGLPVITTRNCVAGLEMIEAGQNGDLINSDNAEELADSIRHFLANQELLDMAAQRGLEISRCYTLEKMVQSHLSFFDELI